MLRKNFPDRRKQRQNEAAQRAEERSKRSNAAQLQRLDSKGFHATKERERLGK